MPEPFRFEYRSPDSYPLTRACAPVDTRIRVAAPSDAAAIRDIYTPFCESPAVTFEETPPTEDEVAERITSTLERYPWLVYERETDVVGYAYAGQLRKRRAYGWVVELSVYVAESARRSGVGEALYESLFAILERQGIRDAYAVTMVPNPETVRFHERPGFERLADVPEIGYTDGDWQDVAWWRRSLAEKAASPDRPRPFPSVCEDTDFEDLLCSGEALCEKSKRKPN